MYENFIDYFDKTQYRTLNKKSPRLKHFKRNKMQAEFKWPPY